MAKFICNTQHASIQNFKGPSGESYVSLKNSPIIVKNDEDIAYFSKKEQFTKYSLSKQVVRALKPSPAATRDDEQSKLFESFIEKLGFSDKVKDKIRKHYGNMNELQAQFVAGPDFEQLTKKQSSELVKALEEQDNKEE